MTTPVDHTPYLRPGVDLVTSSDAAWWLRIDRTERLKAYRQNGGLGVFPCDADLLYALLDRERRQACRRGCFAMAHEAFMWRAAERESFKNEWRNTYRERRAGALRRALAFRAAARQP